MYVYEVIGNKEYEWSVTKRKQMKKNKTVLQNNGHNETLLQQFSTRLPKKK